MSEKSRTSKESPERLPLSRDRVLAAGVAIADERGVNAVTMRAVASELGVEAMSLYNHISNKDDLLDGMLDRVVDEFDLPGDASDWRDAMSRRAISARQVFGRHRWAPVLLDSRRSQGPSALRYSDWVLGVLMEAGFSTDSAARAFSLLDSYIYGFGIQQSNFDAGGDLSPEERAAQFEEFLPAQTYPHLHRMASHAMETGYDAEADFAFGLEIILTGLQQVLDAEKSR